MNTEPTRTEQPKKCFHKDEHKCETNDAAITMVLGNEDPSDNQKTIEGECDDILQKEYHTDKYMDGRHEEEQEESYSQTS